MKPPRTFTCCGKELMRDRTAKTFVIGGIKTEIPRSGKCWCPKCGKEFELKVDRRPQRIDKNLTTTT